MCHLQLLCRFLHSGKGFVYTNLLSDRKRILCQGIFRSAANPVVYKSYQISLVGLVFFRTAVSPLSRVGGSQWTPQSAMTDLCTWTVRYPSIHERKCTTTTLCIICLFSRWTWNPYKTSSGSDLGFYVLMLRKLSLYQFIFVINFGWKWFPTVIF